MRKFMAQLRQMFHGGERIRFTDIRWSKSVYFLAYALELVFFSARSQFLPFGGRIFGIGAWTVIQPLHMVASLVVMLLWSEKFQKLLRGSAVLMLLGFVPYVFLPRGMGRVIFGAIGYIGLGGVVTGARCGYAFVCNNAERLFGIIAMFFAVMLTRGASSLQWTNVFTLTILPLSLLAGLAWCVFRFREEDFQVKQEATRADASGLYWAFAFFILYFAVDPYIASAIDGDLYQSEYLVMLLAWGLVGLLLTAVFLGLRISTWHLWNLFFLAAIGMGAFGVLAPRIGSLYPQYFFAGLSYLGWPLCIYTLGCAQRRFASYALLKKCTLVYVLISPINSIANDLVVDLFPNQLPLVTLILVLSITIVMLMLSPISYQQLFSALWIRDIYKSDMALLQEKVSKADRLGQYGLTPRQKEVAVLLLAAKTRRQIAAELGLSESTVKMHAGELYKKLGINSHTELFRLFGVAELDEGSGS